MKHAVSIGVVLMSAAWLLATGGCGRPAGGVSVGQKKAPLVRVAIAEQASISRTLEVTGNVVAVNRVALYPTVEGPVVFCPWREGDRVQKGEKLVEIDRATYRAELNAAEAKLEDLRAGTRPEEIAKAAETVKQLEQSAAFAKADLARIKTLVESGALPGEALDKARVEQVNQATRLASAKEQLEMLKAGPTQTQLAAQQALVNIAAARLSECVISAPFDGSVARVYVRPGDLASSKSPMVELIDLSSLVIRFAVPEVYAALVGEGTEASVKFDAHPGKTFRAQVVRAYPELDGRMRTRTVEAAVEEAPALVPGMFARLTVTLETVPDAVVVPAEAVLVTSQVGRVAYVVEGDKAVQRKLRLGIEERSRVQVLDGIQPGEKVVVAGAEKLKDGAAVRLLEEAKPEGASPGTPLFGANGEEG